jgi:hypothetical protein
MPDNDGWITPVLTNLPEEGETVDAVFGYAPKRCVFQNGEFWNELHEVCFGAQPNRWRRIPKPELPQIVLDALDGTNERTNGGPWLTERLAALFDTSRKPHLAVVEKPATHLIDGEIHKGVCAELARLRVKMKAERDAVEKILNAVDGWNHTIVLSKAVAVYRKLTTPGDADHAV